MLCAYVCHMHAQRCLSTGWTLNRCRAGIFGTAAVLAKGVGGVKDVAFHKPCKQTCPKHQTGTARMLVSLIWALQTVYFCAMMMQ